MPPSGVASGEVKGPAEVRDPKPTRPAAEARPAEPPAHSAADVLQRIRLELHPGLRSATVQLAPAELGRLSIRLRVREGGVDAVVRAESAEALGLLQQHVHELESALADQGFGEASLELVLDQGGGEGPASGDASRRLDALVEPSPSTDPGPDGGTHLRSDAVGVDTYA